MLAELSNFGDTALVLVVVVSDIAGYYLAASWTSALIILPLGPVPYIKERSTPWLLAKCFADGLAITLPYSTFGYGAVAACFKAGAYFWAWDSTFGGAGADLVGTSAE